MIGVVREFDPIYNSEKHLYALKEDFNILSGNITTSFNDLIQSNTLRYDQIEYNLKQTFFAFKDSFEAEFNGFKDLMHQECENLKSEYNYNVAEYNLRQIFNEFKTRIETEFVDYMVTVTNRITDLFNNHDNYRIELQNKLDQHQNSINQQFEDFRTYLLQEFSSFKFGTGIVERIEAIEEDLAQFKININQNVNNLESDLNSFKVTINQKVETLVSELNNNLSGQLQEHANYAEETYVKKHDFEGDGILLVNNGNIIKLEKPEIPSVLIFDGSEFKWQPYKEYEI